MNTRRAEGILYVKPTEGDVASPIDLHTEFEDFIFRHGERHIVVDLSEVHMLTSLMIGALVSLHLLAYENLVVLTFENMHPKIKNLFELIGVDELLKSHYGTRAAPESPEAPG